MRTPEPSYSIHVAVVRLIDPFTGGVPLGPDEPDPSDPESIRFWAYMINSSWALLGAACIVVMAVVGVAVGLLVGNGAVDYVVATGIAATVFCLAGCPNALYRQYAILPEACRLAQRGDDASQAALRRSLPSNGSLVLQAGAGILAAVITAVNV